MAAPSGSARPDQDVDGIVDGVELVPVGVASKMLGCSPAALKKLAQARQPKVRGLPPGQGRNRSHQWVFVRRDVEERAALMGRTPTPDPRANRDDLAAAYELAEEGRRQEREARLADRVAEGERRIAELEAERDRLWDALESLRPRRRELAT